jgi:PD-(D/E)XK nuclease superfamily
MSTHANPAVGPLAVGPRPDHLSFNQVSKLSSLYPLSCPRQWAYRTLMGLPDRKGPALWFGGALDAGATAYQLARIKDSKDHEKARRTGFNAVVGALNVADLPAEDRPHTFVVDAALMLFDYLADTPLPAEVQSEHQFTVWGADGEIVKVIGRSDWIEQDGTTVDLKWSGTPRWDKSGNWDESWLRQKRDQVCFYHMAQLAAKQRMWPDKEFSANGKGRILVVCHSTRRKAPVLQAVDFQLTYADINRCIGAIQEADAIAGSDRHPPRPGEACRFCKFVDRCQTDSARLASTDAEVAAG